MRVLKLVAFALALSYGLMCLAVVMLHRQLIYPMPKRQQPVSRAKIIAVPQGTALLWYPAAAEAEPAPVVVFFHGNAEQIANTEWLASALHDSGISFAAIEYPGYPGVAGTPTEAGIISGAEAGLRHLTEVMKVDPSRIVLFGFSLGTGPAVQMAAKGWGRKLLLIAPYSSLDDMAAGLISAVPLPLSVLMKDHFDSEAVAPLVKQPVLIFHSVTDEVVPYELGLRLSSKFSPEARFIALPQAGHNDMLDRQFVHNVMIEFIKSP